MSLIYQDPSLLVVNKPAGLPVLSDGWEKDSPYLLQQLERDHGHLFIVHRLDKFTSGVIIFARSAEAHRLLNDQFESRQTCKIYHVILSGLPAWDEHTARHPLRLNVGHRHRTVVDHSRGKPSETQFHLLQRFSDTCLAEARPATGRTHQIRVHAYALGFPLLGDSLYSAPPTNLIPRPALHALSLEFVHPLTNARLFFTAPYPEDFQNALNTLKDGMVTVPG